MNESTLLVTATDDYLRQVSAGVAESLNATLGESMNESVITTRDATDDAFSSEEIVYHGMLYDAVFTKERGPSTTVRMELRQR